jgi:hypothetical protein
MVITSKATILTVLWYWVCFKNNSAPSVINAAIDGAAIIYLIKNERNAVIYVREFLLCHFSHLMEIVKKIK